VWPFEVLDSLGGGGGGGRGEVERSMADGRGEFSGREKIFMRQTYDNGECEIGIGM
jgi:hypothetical protein